MSARTVFELAALALLSAVVTVNCQPTSDDNSCSSTVDSVVQSLTAETVASVVQNLLNKAKEQLLESIKEELKQSFAELSADLKEIKTEVASIKEDRLSPSVDVRKDVVNESVECKQIIEDLSDIKQTQIHYFEEFSAVVKEIAKESANARQDHVNASVDVNTIANELKKYSKEIKEDLKDIKEQQTNSSSELKQGIEELKTLIRWSDNSSTGLEQVNELFNNATGELKQSVTKLTSVKKELRTVTDSLHNASKQISDDTKNIKCDTEESANVTIPSCQPVAFIHSNSCGSLLIQQNVNGSRSFYRTWTEFKAGFQDSYGNLWLGNELLHALTITGRYKLRIELTWPYYGWYWAEYQTFRVASEESNYAMAVAGFSSNIPRGHDGRIYNPLEYYNGMQFTTYDRDNDHSNTYNCAARRGGGFWYNSCSPGGQCYMNSAGASFYCYYPSATKKYKLKTSRMWLMCL